MFVACSTPHQVETSSFRHDFSHDFESRSDALWRARIRPGRPKIHPSSRATARSSGVRSVCRNAPTLPLSSIRESQAAMLRVSCWSPVRLSRANPRLHRPEALLAAQREAAPGTSKKMKHRLGSASAFLSQTTPWALLVRPASFPATPSRTKPT